MKKSLSLLIALAMVFGMFASMASAATTELTTAQKYQWFVDQGVLKGDPSGNPRLDSTLTRAEFATIVASVGGLKLVNTASSFSDVKVKDWYFTAIQSASDAGLVNGIGAGKFGPKLNVTVEQVIKVAVTLAGIKPVEGAVVAGSSAWAGPYIQAATNAGLAVPSNYKANATRGQTIDVAYVVTQLKALPVLSDVTATINADDTITVAGKVVNAADSVKVALGTAAEVAATLKDDKTFTYTTAKQVPGTYKLTVVAYDGTKASVAVTKEVTIGGFVVESATAINNKQIAIKYNKAVQEGVSVGGVTYGIGASNTAVNYVSLAGEEPISASVSSDKTTVTYTFAPFPNNSYKELAVSGLKSASGQTISAYKAALLLNDTTAPAVTGVTYAGNTATVSFSESIPATNLGTLSINGAQINPGTVGTTTGIFYTTITDTSDGLGWVSGVKIHNLTLGTNYSFYIIGGTDKVGNRFADYNTTLTAPTDTVAPTVVSLTASGSTITVKFSEAINGLSNAGAVYNGSSSTGTPAATLSDDQLTATYNVNWLGGNSFLNTTAVVKGYKDLVNNTGADYSASVTLSKDSDKPTVAGSLYDGTYVYIKFSEAVDISARNPIRGTYTNSNSVRTDINWATTSAAVGYDANNDGDYADSGENFYVRIPVSTLGAGTYSLSIPGNLVVDKAATPNANDASSSSFTVSAGSTSGVIELRSVTVDPENNSKITFVFDREVAPSALDVAKYTINGAALPTNTVLYFQPSQQTVVAEVPAGTFPVSGQREVKVNNIVDAAGNTLNTNKVTALVTFKENVAPVAQTVVVNSDTQLAVTFSETLDVNSAAGASGIFVYINSSTSATSVNSYTISGNTLYINANGGTFSTSQAIQVKFANATVKDLNKNKAADVTINK
ncbi:S-layer homology domain-containing protein [Cohnella sp. GCM10020058]|uniref:S-layer homology domain-containing protein n=1 Tax=Cohnella sp. GCM10020058 TaxID=3317330 RepID=UPI0036368481